MDAEADAVQAGALSDRLTSEKNLVPCNGPLAGPDGNSRLDLEKCTICPHWPALLRQLPETTSPSILHLYRQVTFHLESRLMSFAWLSSAIGMYSWLFKLVEFELQNRC